MAGNGKQKSNVFGLVVDEQTAAYINLMVGAFMVHFEDIRRAHPEQFIHTDQIICLQNFVKDFSTKIHKYNWCKDPRCKDNHPSQHNG